MIKRIFLLFLGALSVSMTCVTYAMAGVAGGREEYPRTGTQIAIAVVVVVVLLVGGILLWYFSHPRKRKSIEPHQDHSESDDQGSA